MVKLSATRLSLAVLIGLFIQACLIHAQSRRSRPNGAASGQNCTDHLKIIDRCSSLATYSYTTPINAYPSNLEEMRASCDRIADGLKCLKIHGKCLSTVARRSLNSFSSGRSKHSKKLCSNLQDAKASEFWKASECINRNKKVDSMVDSEKELITTIRYLASNATLKWEERFHQACCAASTYKLKVLTDIEPECSKFKVTTDEMLDSMVGELLESACPETNRLKEICNKMGKLNFTRDWKQVSLTGAALDLIVVLADNPK